MTGTLAGKRALVTGASQGIGLQVCRALRAEGAWVGMVARRRDVLNRIAAEMGGHALPADISSREEVDSLAAAVDELIDGPPDVIVNSAGAFALAGFAETISDDFDRQLDVNLRGPFLLVKAFLSAMIERGSGHILNVGSVAGRVALPGNAGYSASKYGLRGLHEVLAVELMATGVRTTLIEPAATDTPLWDELDPDNREDLPSRSRMLRPDDVARSVVFALAQPAGVEVSYLALRAAG